MDGTLLDSRSQVLPSSVAAIKAALASGVNVMLATGKARPAAIAAMQKVGLVGDGLVVGRNNPGLFLQGLAVHGFDGDLIGGGCLTSDIVVAAFEYSLSTGTPICGFLGDECVTIGTMSPEIEELHTRYYEPLAVVAPSVDAVLAMCSGNSADNFRGDGTYSSSGTLRTIFPTKMRKLLFMTSSEVVSTTLKPHWEARLLQTDAATMQAVPEMLEIVPRGWNKFVGLQQLLRHAALPVDAVMAIGDGGNDFELVQGVGVGIAMGNAVPEVKKAAVNVVASNDDGGIAEAIEKYIL
jgi:hydroxymethylpyrimidine pyrophosphatase-like HAD family hydrolase